MTIKITIIDIVVLFVIKRCRMISSLSKAATISYDAWFSRPKSIVTANSNTTFQYGAGNERVLKQNSYNGQTYTTRYVRGLEDYPLIEESPQGRRSMFMDLTD